MPDPVHAVEEEIADLTHEAAEGASPRTPLLVLSGVSLFVAVVVVFILALAFLAYFLS